jgi:predicted enzyme related to lactoylglutathione lyase
VLFAGVAVSNFDEARAWYERLLGRPADIVANDDEVMWRFADAAWMCLLRDPERAGRSLVTLCVPELDRVVEEIAGRGILDVTIEIVGTAGRKAPFRDPDGNVVALIEVTAASG